MKFEIFDLNMQKVSFVDKYISMLWREDYNDLGAFLLELVETEEHVKKIRPDCFVAASGRECVMVITSVSIKNGVITATGKMASWILSNMVSPDFVEGDSSGLIEIGSSADLKSFLQNALRSAYNNHPNKGYASFNYNNIDLADNNVYINDYYTEATGQEPLLDIVKRVCKFGDIGFMLRRKTTSDYLTLYLYKPEDAEADENPDDYFKIKTFSPDFGNMKDYSVSWSVENYKNCAIVFMEGEEPQSVISGTVGTTPIPYRDIVIEASNDDSALATSNAKLQLKNFENIVNVSFTPVGEGYNIGDIVKIVIKKYDIDIKRRIIRYTIQESKNTSRISIEVGTPIAKIAYIENGRTVYY